MCGRTGRSRDKFIIVSTKLAKINNKRYVYLGKFYFHTFFWLDSHLFCRSDFKQNKFECVFLSDLHIYHSNIHVQLRRVTTKSPYMFGYAAWTYDICLGVGLVKNVTLTLITFALVTQLNLCSFVSWKCISILLILQTKIKIKTQLWDFKNKSMLMNLLVLGVLTIHDKPPPLNISLSLSNIGLVIWNSLSSDSMFIQVPLAVLLIIVGNRCWVCSPIYIKHMLFWNLVLDPNPTTHDPSIGDCLRWDIT